MSRIIGIRHQEKKTVGGEDRPTQFFISEDGKERVVEFDDIADELNWVAGKFVTGLRDVTDFAENISVHQGFIVFDELGDTESVQGRHPSQVREVGARKKKIEVARKVPSGYDGVRDTDVYVSMMGGSGHMLVAGLSARLEKLGSEGKAYHMPPNRMADRFGKDRDKDEDAKRLVELFHSSPELFYEVVRADRLIAEVKSCWNLRKASQLARIAHGLRLRKVAIMRAYADPEMYAGAGLEAETLQLIAGDTNMEELEDDESEATKALDRAVRATDVWDKILSQVQGIGPAIAGGLIAAIGTIARFHKPGQLATYCGVAVVPPSQEGGYATIQRRRSGEFSGWNNDARKCLWNFADQCNRRPDSVWGEHLLHLKEKIRDKHPVPEPSMKDGQPVVKNGKSVMRYTKGHVHKIAIWRLQTDFIFWLWREWGRLVKYGEPKDFRPPGNRSEPVPDLATT